MSSKQAFPAAQRGVIFHASPLSPADGGFVKFVGVDKDSNGKLDDASHVLYSVTRRNTTIDAALFRSIKTKGVIAPVLVRKNGPDAEVIVGRRRLFHLRAANAELIAEGQEPWTLPMVKWEGTDAELLELMLTENLDREDESDEEQARLAKRLLLHKSKEHVAEVCKCSVVSLTQLLQILDLDPLIQANTGKGKFFSRDAAVKLVDETFDRQRAIYQELYAEKTAAAPVAEDYDAAAPALLPMGEVAAAAAPAKKAPAKPPKAVRASARDVESKIKPEKAQKLRGGETKRVIAMLEQDAARPKAKRYFQYEDPVRFMIDLLRLTTGDLKVAKIKGMTAVVNGTVVPDEEK